MISRGIRKRPTLTRWLLAGPGVVLAALLSMATMPLWLPAGEAGVNNLAFPLVLAPLLWAIAFFYVALESDLVRAALVICGLIAAQFFVAVAAFF